MFKGKVIWITGASSGIGEAVAYEMAKEGARLILSARREGVLKSVAEKCIDLGAEAAEVLALDVTDSGVLEATVRAAYERFGQLDLFFNNAGISQRSQCVETSMATYRHLFEVDVFGPIALTKYLLPYMQQQGSGHLVATASVAGKIGVGYRTGYCAAKHAIMGFCDALRAEVAPHGIQVTTITPGFIRTNISENAVRGDGTAFGKMDKNIAAGMDVTDCAAVIMKGLKKGKPEIAVGTGVEMHGLWIKRFFPRLALKIAERATARASGA